MKIAITTSSDCNPYASTLMCRLTAESLTPSLVISTHRSRAGQVSDSITRDGVAVTARRLQMRRGQEVSARSDPYCALAEYARAHGFVDWALPLSGLAPRFGCTLLRTRSINAPDVAAAVRDAGIDLIINAGGGLFRKTIIGAPNFGILNAHMGYLPTYRGMNVLEWSIYNGVPPGVTLHFIDTGVDTGDMLLYRDIPVAPDDTIESLRAKSLVVNIELMLTGIRELATGGLSPVRQEPAKGRQYFVMHPRLKRVAAARLHQRAGEDLRLWPMPSSAVSAESR